MYTPPQTNKHLGGGGGSISQLDSSKDQQIRHLTNLVVQLSQ